jgi:beta-glucanase (GH16 family)
MAATIMVTSVSAKDYSGAELYSYDSYMYGKFEARMQMGTGSGLVSSMFLYYDDSWEGKGKPWVEVDIEVLGKSPQSFQSNIISGTAERKVMSEAHHAVQPLAHQAFHTYGMEWTPDYVAWFLDGVEVRRTQTGVSDPKNQVIALTEAQSLRFNLWSSEVPAWVGAWDESILPVHQFINWVKVYDYTPGQGPQGSDFTLKWVDDFDTFDAMRWGKGNWTFDENRVDMHPDNLQVQDGMLIISITKKGEEGFTGTVPVDSESSTALRPIITPERKLAAENIRWYNLQGRWQK